MKIVSTVPSITELLYDLDMKEEVVGLTKFCIHPHHWHTSKAKIGGTKNINIEKIKNLKPDFIICNKEENVKEQIDLLRSTSTIIVTDIKTPQDNLDLILSLGNLLDKVSKSNELHARLEEALHNLSTIVDYSAIYLIWTNPWMTVGGDTYIHSIMNHVGLHNVYGNKERYPTLTIDDIKKLAPERILLSSEPFPFSEKHVNSLKSHLGNVNIRLVDGEVFSWYGTRLIHRVLPLKNWLRSL